MNTQKMTSNMDENIKIMQSMLGDDKTVKLHYFRPADKSAAMLNCCLFFVDGMVLDKIVKSRGQIKNLEKEIKQVVQILRDRLAETERACDALRDEIAQVMMK